MSDKLANLLREPAEDPMLAGLHPLTYAMYASGGTWKPAAHLAAIAILMTAVATRRPEVRRVQVSLPPRSGKSQFISDYFLAWHLGMFPDRRLMLASYGQSYVEGWALKTQEAFAATWNACWKRNALRSNGVAIHPRHRDAAWWWLAPPYNGYLTAAGVGGVLTGKGADGLVCDDLVKSQAEADSEVIRQSTFEFVQGTAMTRLEPGGWATVLATRWHEADPMGQLLEWAQAHPNALQWTVFNLPVIADEDEEWYLPWDSHTPLWARRKGEPLWPERWPIEEVEQIREATHPRIFNAQYMGRPSAKGGDLFKTDYFKTYTRQVFPGTAQDVPYFELGGRLVAEKDTWTFATMDVAGTVKTSSDYTAIGVWTVAPTTDGVKHILLREVRRFRLETPDQPDEVDKLFADWPQLVFLAIEDKTYGQSLIQIVVRKGLPIKPVKADVDKVARSLPMSLKYMHGQVWHPQSADWLEKYEHELCAFPNGLHDDMVDMASYAGRLVDEHQRPYVLDTDEPIKTEQPQLSLEEHQAEYLMRLLRDDNW